MFCFCKKIEQFYSLGALLVNRHVYMYMWYTVTVHTESECESGQVRLVGGNAVTEGHASASLCQRHMGPSVPRFLGGLMMLESSADNLDT